MKHKHEEKMYIPDDALESFARCIFPAIRKFYESEDGQREFEEWKKQNSHKN